MLACRVIMVSPSSLIGMSLILYMLSMAWYYSRSAHKIIRGDNDEEGSWWWILGITVLPVFTIICDSLCIVARPKTDPIAACGVILSLAILTVSIIWQAYN